LMVLRPFLEHIPLNLKDVLVEPNTPIEYVHFLERGIASVVAITSQAQRIEVSIVGPEGMTGTQVLSNLSETPLLTFVQVAGSALRMPIDRLTVVMAESATLRDLLLRYSHTQTIQIAHTALALSHFTVQQRLARWILMSHDRSDGNDLPMTHEFLALMLGVRRSGVTEALHVLEGDGMIKSLRAHVVVRDREKLKVTADGSYGCSEREYDRVIGESRLALAG
jgi:CRP-like cAMP-binding protein